MPQVVPKFVVVAQACALACALVFAGASQVEAADPIRVMLLDGESGGPYHDWRTTTPILKKELQETGLFQVDVVTAPKSGGDFSHFQPDFSSYRAIVSNLDSQEWPVSLQYIFEQYVRNGGGLAVVHAADNAFPGWVSYNEMIGVGGWRGRDAEAGPHWFIQDGKLTADPSPGSAGSAGSHGARLPFPVTVQDGGHPIVKGIPEVWMHSNDELYANLRGPGQNMKVLATAYSDPANHGTGRNEPILMVVSYGKGRVFHTTLGHDAAALSCVGFITTYQRGVQWVATGNVTIPVPASFPTAHQISNDPAIATLPATEKSK